MHILIIFSLLFTTSCSLFKKKEVTKTHVFNVIDHTVYPGKVKKVSVKLPKGESEGALVCGDKTIGTSRQGNTLFAYVSVNYRHLLNKRNPLVPCFLKIENVNHHVFNLRVKEWKYPKSYIKVAKKHVDLSKEDIQRFLKEKETLNEMYKHRIMDKKLFTSNFMRPLKSKVTAIYGSRRVFNNKKDSWHSGTDLRARKPTPIPSSNAGIVAHASHLFFNGKAVFIDHGMGIMTMYCHLSRIDVKEGDVIKKGQIIGLSGNTGRSSAPHLHWGVRVQGDWVDGLQFLKEQDNAPLKSSYKISTNN